MTSDTREIQLLLLPGLGADGRMAHNQLSLPYTVIHPDYIPWHRGEPLGVYAKRYLDHLLEQKLIDRSRPLYLGGASLGGAMAQEISRYLPASGVILIGSLRKGTDLRKFIGFFGKHIAARLPLWVYDAATYFIPLVMGLVSQVDRADIDLSIEMYRSLPKGLYREGFRAIANWPGCTVNVPVLRIHGENDHIIPLPKDSPIDLIVKDTRHLVGLSHPAEVNREIERFITSNEAVIRNNAGSRP